MSHIVEIQTEVRDPVAVRSACDRLSLPRPTQGTFKLFSTTATGLGVQLPEWRYPVVCETQTSQVRFDNYGGRWGKQIHLDRFLQSYAVEKARLEARKKGHTITEQSLEDGSIKLTVNIGGAA
ncbi:DUF1257 domain-containing protein [Rubinisphaera sp.]|uniref:DUF1257 domain-containing protein n=1 Tax=Rubinisphaera sp. TaxID=2024857 RepID=UPI000C11959D|nr:DUF1257 domain-containing protein [Rubinisphaera sp.]MBV09479.1 DUF1257 domain-containing protein [Rubinisphaera sp.]